MKTIKTKNSRKRYFGKKVREWFVEDPLPLFMAILILGIGLTMTLYYLMPELRGTEGSYWSGVFVEASGALFDVLIFGILITFYNRLLFKRQAVERQKDIVNGSIERQQEIINDYKKWNEKEGNLRIAGAIRRLIALGKTNIDLRGIELSNFNCGHLDINNLSGTTFYGGDWANNSSKDKALLKSVVFDRVNLSNATFSPHHPYKITIGEASRYLGGPAITVEDCSFQHTVLKGANFSGALLKWNEEPPESIIEEDEDEEGNPLRIPTHHPPFEGVDLSGIKFVDTVFENADFREVRDIEKADFTGAQGLESCIFDTKKIKKDVMKRANRKTF